ncbi:MAG: P2 family phage major capsid protein [Victivallaceae bacterium]|nr:P2 family phage major capsid protein [Victivallaceae bacterium]
MSKFYSLEKFNALCAKMAAAYGVPSTDKMFSVDPPRAIKLLNAVQESDSFLALTSLLPTTDIAGDVVTSAISGTVAGTTDTSAAERTPIEVDSRTKRSYLCQQVNFDWAIRYAIIDQWLRFGNYDSRVAQMILRRIGLDLLLIGWYGESHAATSNRTTYPLLQDVHPGWLYDLKTNKPANYITAEALTIGGAASTYKNLDSAAYDLLTLIPKEKRNGNERLIIGQGLLSHEIDVLLELHGRTPTEKQAMQVMSKTFAGMKPEVPAGFPDKGLMVCDPAQLQRYVQDSSLRKQLLDNPKRDRVEHYQSENLDYKIGDLDCVVSLDYTKVEFGD